MILTDSQKKVLDLFRKSDLVDKFYWTGGTLLAYYYLQHRLSLDLDLFSEIPFSFEELAPFLTVLKKELKTPINEHKIYDRWEFVIEKPEITRVEFVHYNHQKKRLKPLKRFQGLLVDTLPDIAANKVMAYFDRNEPKDLFDLYFLLTRKKYSVQLLLKLVEKKFGATFSEFMFWSEAAKSLKILRTLQPLMVEKTKIEKENLIEKISKFFLQKGGEYLNKQLK